VTVSDEVVPSVAFNTREREQEWLYVKGPLYAGKWVAVEGDQLISEGASAISVLEQARAQGVPNPLVVRIPKEPGLPFGGW
jgi:hypothetical protein